MRCMERCASQAAAVHVSTGIGSGGGGGQYVVPTSLCGDAVGDQEGGLREAVRSLELHLAVELAGECLQRGDAWC